MKAFFSLFGLFLFGAVSLTSIIAQDSTFTLKVDVAMVFVDVAVFNAAGLPVTDLGKDNFEVYEDGRRQQLQSFASSSTPYNVLLVIDQSGSMFDESDFVIAAVNRFFANLRPQDRVALASFDGYVHELVDWRSVRQGSKRTIRIGSGGDTDFYGALSWATRKLRKVVGRKAVLIFTDGEDRRIYDLDVDAKAFRKVLEEVRKTNVPFHFVGVDADPERGGAHIKRLAQETGGHAYFPEKIEDVVPLYDQISREMGIAYTLGYVSDRPSLDRSYRMIKVVVPGEEYRTSQSRDGYFAN